MRFLLACLLALSSLSLLWPALGSPLPNNPNDREDSVMGDPMQVLLAPMSELEADLDRLRKRIQNATGHACLDSYCESVNDPKDNCMYGGCSESPDGVLTCSCPEKPTKDCAGHGCNGGPFVSVKYPKTSAYGTKPALNWAGDPIRSPDIVVCNSALLTCVHPGDFSFCTDMFCFDERNNGLECSCPNGTITSWADETPEMAEMCDKWFSEHDPTEDSWVSSTVSVEEATSSTATTLVKRTKEPCPNPKVNPYPPFNFICPGDETKAASNVKRTKEPCPSPKVNPFPPFNFICPGDDDDDGDDH